MTRDDLLQLSGGYTVPQICINGKFIGGFQELQSLHQNNQLMALINE